MRNKILCVVETPLQLLCAFEVIKRNVVGSSYNLLIRQNGSYENDRQTTSMARQLGLSFQTIKFTKDYSYKDIVSLFLFLPVFLQRYDVVYFGSLFSKFLKVLSNLILADEKIYLDDGVATFLSEGLVGPQRKTIKLFTIFDIQESESLIVSRNDFAEVRKFFSNQTLSTPKNIFIGQKVVEAGLMDLENYYSAVAQSKDEAGGKILYIPHRDESEETTNLIKSISGVSVIRSDCCIEMFLLKSGIKPVYIASSFSSALFTLGVLFPKSKRNAWIPTSLRAERIPHYSKIVHELEVSGTTIKTYDLKR